jgi:hypothetical protein
MFLIAAAKARVQEAGGYTSSYYTKTPIRDTIMNRSNSSPWFIGGIVRWVYLEHFF